MNTNKKFKSTNKKSKSKKKKFPPLRRLSVGFIAM